MGECPGWIVADKARFDAEMQTLSAEGLAARLTQLGRPELACELARAQSTDRGEAGCEYAEGGSHNLKSGAGHGHLAHVPGWTGYEPGPLRGSILATAST